VKGTILLHIAWPDKHTSHVWAKSSDVAITLTDLLLGRKSQTRKAVEQSCVMIPKVMPESELFDAKEWLRPEAVCVVCR